MRHRCVLSVAAALLLPLALSALTVFAAIAGTEDGTVIALHAKVQTAKGVCTTEAPQIPCSEYTTTWPLHLGTHVYLVVARAQQGPGIAGFSCGIFYAPATGALNGGVDVFGWIQCADSEYPNSGPYGQWPAPGGGTELYGTPWTIVSAP
jgi:hypothetical protein